MKSNLHIVWRANWSLFLVWFITILVIWILATYIGTTFNIEVFGTDSVRSPLEVLSAWDGTHYASIASKGYFIEGAEARRFAFFPLFPGFARLLGGRNQVILAGLLLSQLCLLGSIILLTQLANNNKSNPLRLQPGFWLLVTPLAFFFSVFYSESLFLFLSLLMVFLYRKERFKFAAVIGILVGLTRATGALLFVYFLVESVLKWRQRKSYVGTLLLAIAPIFGVVLYVAMVGALTGDLLGYSKIQSEFWDTRFEIPFLALARNSVGLLLDLLKGDPRSIDQFVRLFSAYSIIALIVWGWRKIEPSFLAYLIISFVVIHSREPHHSSARYELVLFPIYFLIPKTMIAHPYIAYIIAVLLAVWQLKMFFEFSIWHWVA